MRVLKYRKKPVIITALQFIDTPEGIEKLANFIVDQDVRISYKDPENPKLILQTLEGEIQASVGDYIIKGVQGEFYPCKPNIFEATYEEV